MNVIEIQTFEALRALFIKVRGPRSVSNWGFSKIYQVVHNHNAKTNKPKKAMERDSAGSYCDFNAKRNWSNTYPHNADCYYQNYLDRFAHNLNIRFFDEKSFNWLLVADFSTW